jgi:peptidoglycan/LPS O-acetylase OafA/YrhL
VFAAARSIMTITEAHQRVPADPQRRDRLRLHFLDGIRAVAALFVVVHHIYLNVYDGFPQADTAWYIGWLAFGHFGVAVFIVVSGFSLTLAPARHGFADGRGFRAFINRRAWRIVPPYWAALAISVVIMGALVSRRVPYTVDPKGVVTHLLLVQDVVSGRSPNGAFWSIAIEWQLYFLFPLFLLARRVLGGALTAVGALAGVWAIGVAGENVSPLSKIMDVSPQLAALFVLGIVAAGATVPRPAGAALRTVPWGWLAGAMAGAAVVACIVLGTPRAVSDLYWLDLLVGAAVACGLAALVRPGADGERPRLAARVLGSRPLSGTGRFSYSLYLVHTPLLIVGWLFVVEPLGLSDDWSLVVMLVAVMPVVVALSYAFFWVFERPFLTTRSFAALRPARGHRPLDEPQPVAADPATAATTSPAARSHEK